MTKTALEKVRSEKRKLAILRLLKSEPDFSISAFDLGDTLALMGHRVATHQINQDIAYLHTRKLVTLNDGDGIIATLTQRGADVADALLVVDGVARPSPQLLEACLLYTSPSPRDQRGSRMPSSA